MSVEVRKQYQNYDEYKQDQVDKTSNPKIRQRLSRKYQGKVRTFMKRFAVVQADGFIAKGQKALCLGARMGEEVEALRNMGFDALGVDLVARPPLVIEADFLNLPFDSGVYDIVYSNSFDHAFSPKGFFDNVYRVLKPNGVFILDVFLKDDMFARKEVVYVDSKSDVIDMACKQHGFVFLKDYDDLPRLYRGRYSMPELVFRR
jgi:SAM-dependent methyltransferase